MFWKEGINKLKDVFASKENALSSREINQHIFVRNWILELRSNKSE
jgi:hypothetical protein